MEIIIGNDYTNFICTFDINYLTSSKTLCDETLDMNYLTLCYFSDSIIVKYDIQTLKVLEWKNYKN